MYITKAVNRSAKIKAENYHIIRSQNTKYLRALTYNESGRLYPNCRSEKRTLSYNVSGAFLKFFWKKERSKKRNKKISCNDKSQDIFYKILFFF